MAQTLSGSEQSVPVRCWRSSGSSLTLLASVVRVGETDPSPVAYRAPLRQALIDENAGHVNVVVSEADYRALKRGIEHLPPPLQ